MIEVNESDTVTRIGRNIVGTCGDGVKGIEVKLITQR